MEELHALLTQCLNDRLKSLILSSPRDEVFLKARLRPLLKRDSLCFQAEEFRGKQVFHKNLSQDEACAYIEQCLTVHFRQAQIQAADMQASVLVSKKGKITVKSRKINTASLSPSPLSHNRVRNYLLPEGTPVDFLVELGVMTPEGNVVHARYDKFRQINRFLEFIRDVLPELPENRELTIIDFGCGKSYLTFAAYYYLSRLKGLPVRIIGLDLKEDVIRRCNELALRCGYDGLTFICGDIASYTGISQVDLVMTLHACDTATDYALAKAVSWGARVILSVPCCQHELNSQISCGLLEPLLGYGLIRERSAALFTDAIRARLLERAGYRAQILEFIDMEHTPKNILIRAVYTGRKSAPEEDGLDAVLNFLQAKPMLKILLDKASVKKETGK